MVIKFYRTKEQYGSFSNFARYPVEIDGKVWPTSEHYFQAQKFLDEKLQEQVRLANTPKDAANIGRDRTNPLRADWEKVKDDIMYRVVLAKFTQYKDIGLLLVSTGDSILVEDSPIDSYWGCGADGKGENMLGQILMKVRDELKWE